MADGRPRWAETAWCLAWTGARVVSLMVLSSALVAQEPGTADPGVADVSGTWRVIQACSVRRNPDGSMEVARWCDARLTLEQRGDSLSGTWERETEWGPMIQHVTGRIRPDGVLTLERESTDYPAEAPASQTAEAAGIQSVVYTARVTQGRLVNGIQRMTFRGRGVVDRPWSAERRVGGG